jgi:hypothetical protein
LVDLKKLPEALKPLFAHPTLPKLEWNRFVEGLLFCIGLPTTQTAETLMMAEGTVGAHTCLILKTITKNSFPNVGQKILGHSTTLFIKTRTE